MYENGYLVFYILFKEVVFESVLKPSSLTNKEFFTVRLNCCEFFTTNLFVLISNTQTVSTLVHILFHKLQEGTYTCKLLFVQD